MLEIKPPPSKKHMFRLIVMRDRCYVFKCERCPVGLSIPRAVFNGGGVRKYVLWPHERSCVKTWKRTNS